MTSATTRPPRKSTVSSRGSKSAAPSPLRVLLRPHDSIPRPNAMRYLALPLNERRRILQETREALGSFLPSSDEFRAEQRAEAVREN